MPEHSPGDIVCHPSFPESRYVVVAGPDGQGQYVLTNTDGQFLVRGSNFIALVEVAPGDESDELNMLLERIVKLEERDRQAKDTMQAVYARLNSHDQRLEAHSDGLRRLNTWRQS